MTDKKYIAAIDEGTTSARCIIFDREGEIVSVGQMEFEQIFPQKGWVEHNPIEIWDCVRMVVGEALASADLAPSDLAALGITNQRETTIVWDKNTGEPIYNGIVWQDTRTAGICRELAGDDGIYKFQKKTGLPLSSYSSGPKIKWILDNVEGAREKAENGDLLFGTPDSWILWKLTGGSKPGPNDTTIHATDVTNASRTLLMDINTLEWDEELCEAMGIPMSMLPEIRPSSGDFGVVRERGSLAGVPITGVLGDQQAATFGQLCFEPGQAKNTYGTGLFLLMSTGEEPKFSNHGLITTVCYQIGDNKPVYALEGSVAMGGSLVQWLRDNLKMIPNAPACDKLAETVEDNGGVYFVPAFSGLLAPRWRDDARGVIVGLTRYANRGHIARSVLEATAYQTRELVDAMEADSGVTLKSLKVDGGMVKSEPLMQFQADILDVPVSRPVVAETTALGAAYAAGLHVGFWESIDDLMDNWQEDKRWNPDMDEETRTRLYAEWNKAVERTYGWEETD
ncbi:MAG TPA: glycerol kinase GlpK [Corynebacteriales bacterium]|nr:glycerol kinase GlpK [Mycobacteriales bacterium]